MTRGDRDMLEVLKLCRIEIQALLDDGHPSDGSDRARWQCLLDEVERVIEEVREERA